MKRHLVMFTALFAGVAGSALAGGYGAAPQGVVYAGAAPLQGESVYVNGRSVYDDRGVAATGAPMWGGAHAGAAAYGAPIVQQEVVSSEQFYLEQGAVQQGYVQQGYVQGGAVSAHAPIIEQTTTTQDIVAVTSAQPVYGVAHGGWGPRVFVGAQGGVSFGGAFSGDGEKVKLDTGYGFGVHAGVAFGGGWRAKVEYLRIGGKLDLGGGGGGGGHGGGGHGGGKPCGKPVLCGKGGYGGGGHGGGSDDEGYGGDLKHTANAGFFTVEKAFEVSKTFQPYVGLGVGYVKPKMDGLDGSLSGSFAAKASVGASVALSQQVEAYGEYAYVIAPDVECRDCGESGSFKVDYDTHLLSAGLRVHFK